MNIKELLQVIKTMDVNVKENTISKTTGLDIIEITGKNYFNIDIEGKIVKVSYIIKTGEIINHWIDDNGNVIHLCLPIIFNGELKLPSIKNASQIANELNEKIILNKVERDKKDNTIIKYNEKAQEETDIKHKIINSTTYGAIDGIDIETGEHVDEIVDDGYVCESAKFDLVDKITIPKGEGEFMINENNKINENVKSDCVFICGKPYDINREFSTLELDDDNLEDVYDYNTLSEVIEAGDIDEIESIYNNEGDVEIMNNPFEEYEEIEKSIEEKRESLEKMCDEESTKIIECKVGDKIFELEQGMNCNIVDFNIFNGALIVNIGLTPLGAYITPDMNSFLDAEIEFLYEELEDSGDGVIVALKDLGTFRMSMRNILEDGLGAWCSFDNEEFRLSPLEFRGLTTLFVI